jgi:hypothetical protein
MSKLDGGIFSNPSGKTAGIVFGAARTRQGKKVTARQLVSPSNPNTAAQQTQRGKFSDSLDIVRFLGSEVYQSDFNRAISQLPGFQSMMSIYMNAMDDSKVISAPPAVNLGTLHFPDTFTLSGGAAGDLDVNLSAEVGDNGTINDEVVAFAIDISSAGRSTLLGYVEASAEPRSAGGVGFSDLTSGNSYLVGCYMRGTGAAAGILTQCKWLIAAAG